MQVREKEISEFLKSRQGIAYLTMKYPKCSLAEATRQYLNKSTI